MNHRARRVVGSPSWERSLLGALFLAACGVSTSSPDVARDASDARDATTDVRDARAPSDVSSRCLHGAPPYPTTTLPVIEGRALPDMRFETEGASVSLHDWYAPAPRRRRCC